MQAHLFHAVESGEGVVEVLIWLMLSDISSFFLSAQEHDITWGYLLTMEKEDLEKVEDDTPICLSVSSSALCQTVGWPRERRKGSWRCCCCWTRVERRKWKIKPITLCWMIVINHICNFCKLGNTSDLLLMQNEWILCSSSGLFFIFRFIVKIHF